MYRGALCGFIEQNRVGFTSNNLKTILAENRFSFSPVISEWEKNGWLEKESGTGNNPQFKYKQTRFRCITINSLGLKAAGEDDDEEKKPAIVIDDYSNTHSDKDSLSLL